MFYLEDQELARKLIKIDYHWKGKILTRNLFMERKQAIDD